MLVFLNYSAVLPIIQAEWGLTNAQAGSIYSAYQVGYILLAVFLTTLTDYVDTKKIYVASALWAGCAGIAFALFADSFWSALVLRCLTGFGLAGTYMPGLKMVSARFSPHRRGWAVGMYVGAFSFGTALALLFSGLLTGLFSWRTAMFVTSLGPILGGWIAARVLDSMPPTRAKGDHGGFKKVFENRPALLVMVGYAAHMWEMFGMRGWIVAFLAAAMVSRNVDMATATSHGAIFSALIILAGGFSTAWAGAISDRYGRVKTIQVIMISSAACSFLFGWIRPWPAWLVVGISLVYGFLVTAESSVLSTSITELVPFEYLGSAMAVQSLIGWTAAAISPTAFGFVLDLTNPAAAVAQQGFTAHWGPAFVLLGLGALLGPVVLGMARKRSGNEYR